ncbi:MAG: FHA domain-containing protein [Coriobacteriia bacterium]|nr:FHA domain-containing protein [Coriobacteriia bacterium]
MVDIILLAGKLVLLALLYLFLFAAIRAGIGTVRGAGPRAGRATPLLKVVQGPRELKGLKVPVSGPVVIGRSPGADIVIADDFISSQHARVVPSGDSIVLEDLGSTNGTIVNGHRVTSPVSLSPGDEIDLGTVRLKVERP